MTRVHGIFISAIVTLAAIVLVGILDFDLRKMHPLAESPPIFDRYFALRSLFAFLLSAFFAVLIYRNRDEAIVLPISPQIYRVGFSISCVAACIMIVAIELLVFSPAFFKSLAVEDSIFEWASALLLFMGGGFLAVSARRTMFVAGRRSMTSGLAMFLGLIMFVIGMEEVSWLQRVFDWRTPGWLREINAQRETNLHNIIISEAENSYYAGAFLLMVVYPFVSYGSSVWNRAETLKFFVPSRHVLLIGAFSTTFSYEMWNIFWMQAAFYFGLAALFISCLDLRRSGSQSDFILFLTAFFILLTAQIINLSYGSNLIRAWEDTELKEFIIAAGLFLFAIEIGLKMSKIQRMRWPGTSGRGGERGI
jgi:hypothetical protein